MWCWWGCELASHCDWSESGQDIYVSYLDLRSHSCCQSSLARFKASRLHFKAFACPCKAIASLDTNPNQLMHPPGFEPPPHAHDMCSSAN